MSRVRNANEFLERLSKAREYYQNYYRPRVERVRAGYLKQKNGDSSIIDNLIEAQIREYFIDTLLNALNWRMEIGTEGEFPNLIPEAQVESSMSGTRRFLDYLGLTREDKPLLIVETKRPNSLLPKEAKTSGKANVLSSTREKVISAICAGLKGEKLIGDWNEWLTTLADYVNSTFERSGHLLRRAVITSGKWFFIFLNPADSFLPNGTVNPDNILFYEKRDELESNYQEIFGALEYQRVLNEAPPLVVEEIPFFVLPEDVTQILHGLKLKYIEDPGFLENSPRVKVMPILYLRTQNSSWILVESRIECEIPFQIEEMNAHLETVNQIASDLLNRVNTYLGINIEPTTIETYFEDETAFEILPGVSFTKITVPPQHEEYLIITGQNTHYFHLEPTIPNCPHHEWAASHQHHCATPITIQSRSVNPRSFFKTGEVNHCNHVGVELAKAGQIPENHQELSGLRSGKRFDPFCEIWRFETRLCCRTCIYEKVCTKAKIFNLPC